MLAKCCFFRFGANSDPVGVEENTGSECANDASQTDPFSDISESEAEG